MRTRTAVITALTLGALLTGCKPVTGEPAPAPSGTYASCLRDMADRRLGAELCESDMVMVAQPVTGPQDYIHGWLDACVEMWTAEVITEEQYDRCIEPLPAD